MATILEITRNLKKLINDTSDDYKISDRQLLFIINYVRAALIRQDYEKKRSLSGNVIQGLGKVEFEKVDRTEDSVTKSYSYIIRTKLEIPKPIEFYNKDGITFVGSFDKIDAFQVNGKAQSRWSKNFKWTGDKPRAYYRNGRIYVEGCGLDFKWGTIEGVWEDPMAVARFVNEDGTSCYNLATQDYPISIHTLNMLNPIVLDRELRAKISIPDDIDNDASKIILQ